MNKRILILLIALLAALACQQSGVPKPTSAVLPQLSPTVIPTEAPPSPVPSPPVSIIAETIQIYNPAQGDVITGGVIEVTGYSEYFFESNLALALCGAGGDGEPHHVCGSQNNVLAIGNAMIASPDMGLPGPFSGTLTYSVEAETVASLLVYSLSPRDGSIEHLSSVIITVRP